MAPHRTSSTLRQVMTAMIGSIIFVPASMPAPVQAAGPWRGRVVDAETREALEGAVVVGYWRRSLGGHPTLPFPFNIGPTGYWGSEEVTTDPDGRFVLPSRILINPGLSTSVSGPHLAIFKAGYGGWRFDPSVQWPSLLGAGGTIEMEPLHTLEERRLYVSGMRALGLRSGTLSMEAIRHLWRDAGGPHRHLDEVPQERRIRYDEAIEWERTLLGLRPCPVLRVPVRCTRITMDGCE